jgi:hypothetical protein
MLCLRLGGSHAFGIEAESTVISEGLQDRHKKRLANLAYDPHRVAERSRLRVGQVGGNVDN